ncbi:MAG: molybdopterin-dependent oxidoreductase [Treponema sp.]|nr:molybdopterin-dependent oxidoreductase [Candidatus Treponema caballi]
MPGRKKAPAAKIDHYSAFYSDIRPASSDAELMYACLIRSPFESGILQSVLMDELPKEYSIITAKDIPGENKITTLDSSFVLLACNRISYRGQPVGILVGPDRNMTEKLVRKITVTALPSQQIEKPQQLDKRTLNYGNFDETYEKCPHHIENTYHVTHTEKYFSEPNGAYADCARKNDVRISTPTKWIGHLRKNIAQVLNCTDDAITIQKTIASNSNTGAIWNNTVLACQAAVASKVIGKPVLLMLSREEQELYIDSGDAITVSHKTGFEDDGEITAASVTVMFNSGCYAPFLKEIVDRLAITAMGAYKPLNLHIDAFAISSNTPPAASLSDGIENLVCFALESQLDAIAHETKLNPAEIKLRNYFPRATHPRYNYPLSFNTSLLLPVIDEVQKISDYQRRRVSYAFNLLEKRTSSWSLPVRGIGLSTGYQGSVFFASALDQLQQTMTVTMDKDSQVTIFHHMPSSSISNIWTEQAAALLDCPAETIHIDDSYFGTENLSLPDTMTGDISILMPLLKKCCTSIQRARFRQPLPITAKKKLTRPHSLSWDNESFSGTPFYSVAWGAAVVELELNPLLYTVHVKNVWYAIHSGKLLNRQAAETSIKKNTERILTYLIKDTQLSADNITIVFDEGDEDPREIGNLVQNLLPGAFAAAITQSVGKHVTRLPLDTDSIYRMVQSE